MMHYEEMPRLRTAAKKAAVRLAASKVGCRALVVLSFHRAAFENCAVLAHNKVKVLRGTDGERQVLRIVAGGTWLIGEGGGRASGAFARITMPRPSWLQPPTRLHAECDYDYGDDWIEVELPAWFKEPAPPAPRAPFVPAIPNQPRGAAPPRRP